MPNIVLDNGAYTLKVGRGEDDGPRIIPNCISRCKSERRRNFIGDQIEECKDLSGVYYLMPFQKGYLVNWDTQRQVWDYVFGAEVLKINPDDCHLVFTEPVFNFPSIQEALSEIFFEEYAFNSLTCTTTPTLANLHYTSTNPSPLCTLVVDTGFSFTHIVPHYGGRVVPGGVVRVDVGGKLLTNHLKEIVSYRQLQVMDETHVMNQVKEDVCYVTQDFYGDMEVAKRKGESNTIVQEYVLPDYSARRRGFVRPPCATAKANAAADEQCLRLSNERFSIPEILFHPSDIGLSQMGIPEAVVHSVSLTPKEMHPHLYGNILVVGGNTLFPGFYERLVADIRKLVPDDYDINLCIPKNPIGYSWLGGRLASDNLPQVSQAEYKEHGHSICHRKFVKAQTWEP
ncbi:hypothetical protein EMCRGX_G020504 [Ephydatia muelleri]|eukprot:Em0016g425a